MTAADKVLRVAEAELGVTEEPPGSNTGPSVRQYQQATSLPGTGWPWCAAFVEWVWEQAGVSTDACSPSTAVMAAVARRLGWDGDPAPGAAVVWPGVHTGILVAPISPGVWATIEGNTADGVHRRTRSLTGTVIVRPPELGDPPPPRVFLLEDPAARPRLVGPWRTRVMRDRAISRLPRAQQDRARRVTTPAGRHAFLLGPRRTYGPWVTVDARDQARAVLEDRLGRRLRPYSRPAPAQTTATTGVPEGLGKTT